MSPNDARSATSPTPGARGQHLAVSVVIPTYNRAPLVARAIDSALAAIEPGDEIIVVDDGSTDETPQILARYGDPVRSLRVRNRGAGSARNVGIREARNPLVAFLDSDDEWMPDHLVLHRRVMQAHPDVMCSFSDFAVRDPAGREERFYLVRWHHDTRGWDEILGPGVRFSTGGSLPSARSNFTVHVGDLYPILLRGDYVYTCTFVARRAESGPSLRFAEDLPIYEDWECFARVAQIGPAAFLNCETVWNHGHEGPRISDADDFTRATNRLVVLERVWGADQRFRAQHQGRYERELLDGYLTRFRYFMKQGRTREARQELRRAGRVPIAYRVLATLPGPVVAGLLGVRTALRERKQRTASPRTWDVIMVELAAIGGQAVV